MGRSGKQTITTRLEAAPEPDFAPDPALAGERSGRLLEAVFRNATVAMFVMDERQHCIYMNPAAERLTGFNLAEVQGRALHDIIHHTRPDGTHYPLEECPIDRAFPENHQEQGEEVFVHRDGSFYPVAYTASPIREEGVVVGTIIEVQDLTAAKRAAAELQERNETLELIRQASLTLGSELDLDRLVQTLTDIGVQVTGAQFGAFFYNVLDEKGGSYTLYTLSGAPLEAFSGYPMPRATHVFGPTFRGEGVVRSDDITRDPRYGRNAPYEGMPEGHLPVRSYLAVPVISRSGEVLGGLFFGHAEPGVFTEGVERTVTAIAAHAAVAIDNARLYDRVRRFNERLEQQVEARTKELRVLNQELETFNYSVSHDLRAPLRGIDGFSQALLEDYGDALDETAKRYLQRIRRGTIRMADLVDALLELSQLSRATLRPREVDLREVAMNVIAGLREGDPSHRVRVVLGEDLRAFGDAALLQVVLENILENSWKYTRGREDALVEIRKDERDGEAVFVVRDNGAGFDMHYADKLFAPFGRLHSDEEFEGTGIGLATVQRVIYRHGGRVWAESVPGEGATFFFTLGPE